MVSQHNSGIIPLYEYQKEWIRDDSRFKMANKGRQTGFSFACALEALLDAVERKTMWVLLSRGERQSKELMEKVQMHAKAIGHVCEVIESDFKIDKQDYKMLELTLPNGSRIIGLPANPDTARGFSANVFLDEFAFHKDSRKIWTALYPTITRGYKIRVVSTPNGKSGKFYELWTGDNKWTKHKIDIYRAVNDGLELSIEELREGCDSEEDWLQEFCCEFLDEASAFLTFELITACESDDVTSILLPESFSPTGDLYLGFDVARRKHLSVIWIDEKIGDVFYTRVMHEMHKMTFRDQKKILYEYLSLPNMRRACIDATGIGANIAEDAQLDFGKSKVEQVTFTSASKEEMAINMYQVPINSKLRNDLHSVKKLVTASGNVRYDAEQNEDGHADRFWAKALCLHAGKRPPASKPEYLSIKHKNIQGRRAF